MTKKEKAKSGARFVGSGLYGGLLYSGVKFLVPDFAREWQSPVDKGLTGAVMHFTKRGPAKAFLTVAVAEAVSIALDRYVMPFLGNLAGIKVGLATNGGGLAINYGGAGRNLG